jgi:hypothetical protein
MANTNYTFVSSSNSSIAGTTYPLDKRSLNLMAKESEIIRCFAQGQQQAITSENLKLEYTETSIRLSNNHGKLIGISKQVNKWQRKVLISNNSVYKSTLVKTLVDSGFVARQKSSHPEFSEYHYYQVPDGYNLKYTEIIQLWRTWWHNKRYQLNVVLVPIDLLIFIKGNWYPIKDLQPKQGSFVLLTARGEMTIEAEDYIVWIDSAESTLNKEENSSTPTPAAAVESADLKSPDQLMPENYPAGVVSLVDAQLPESEEYIDLEAYLSTFNTEDSEDIGRIEEIYNIDKLLSGNMLDRVSSPPPKLVELPPQPAIVANSDQIAVPVMPVAPPAISNQTVETSAATQSPTSAIAQSAPLTSQRQKSLKLKAINVLATYLTEGEMIVHTEVLKNNQGQEINRKVTKIQRGCPRWAIEQVKKISQ